MASFISRASIFFPRYSGVRPTISPAMKTVSRTKTRIPYMPAPTPPKITSPSWMFTSGTSPPSGVKLSCIAFTAPQEASVVTVANSAEAATPNRVSFPSMLSVLCCSPAMPRSAGLPCASAEYVPSTPAKNSTAMAAKTAQPCRWSRAIRPYV